jgi:hypothetical protein
MLVHVAAHACGRRTFSSAAAWNTLARASNEGFNILTTTSSHLESLSRRFGRVWVRWWGGMQAQCGESRGGEAVVSSSATIP